MPNSQASETVHHSATGPITRGITSMSHRSRPRSRALRIPAGQTANPPVAPVPPIAAAVRHPRPRTYFSVLMDALTANVLILGFYQVVQTFHLSFATPIPVIAGDVIGNVVKGALFIVLFYFLVSDWADARRIDAASPYTPAPGGWRLYVDILIVGMFYPAFILAARADVRLAPLLALIFLTCAIWCLLVATRGTEDVKLVCTRYMWTHLIGCGIFACTTAWFYIPNQPAYTSIAIVLSYVVWELIDRNLTRDMPDLAVLREGGV